MRRWNSPRFRRGPDKDGNWKIHVEPALLRMMKAGWGKWVPKQVKGSDKFIFLPEMAAWNNRRAND